MIIDFHTHIFPEKIAADTISLLAQRGGMNPFTYGKTQELLDSMEQAGVGCSVVLPVVTKPGQFKTVNAFAEQLNREYRNPERRILAFGGIHPDTADYRQELDELVNRGFVGIKLHPDYQKMMIDDIRYMRIIEYAMERKLIVSVHAGVDVGLPNPVHCTPKAAKKVIRSIRPDRLILAHMGGWKMWDEVEEALVGEEVYFDTAVAFGYLEEEQFVRILRNHGSDKILFATDSPWGGQKESVEALKKMELTREETECVLFKNASSLLFGKNSPHAL